MRASEARAAAAAMAATVALSAALVCTALPVAAAGEPESTSSSSVLDPARVGEPPPEQGEHYVFPQTPDPLEPFNRSIWALNEAVVDWVVLPTSRVWRGVTPRPLRAALLNAGRNLLYPVRLVNNLLQAKLDGAWHETVRFTANSTIGIGGLFDPASDWGYVVSDEDAGQTFAKWGWTDSTYLVLPLLGPSTFRDTLGLVPDTALDPLAYYFPGTAIRTFLEQSESAESLKRFLETYYDPYQPARRLYTVSRTSEGRDYEYESPPGRAGETLEAVFLSHRDPWFPRSGRSYTVRVPWTGRKMSYDAWLQPKPAPIVFIVPGLGSHRRSEHSLALAEMVYREGFSAVTISNPMCYDFMDTAASTPVPGFAPADARDVSRAIRLAYVDLSTRHSERITGRVLMGMSLGAFHTLLIAAWDQTNAKEAPLFDRYVAINPPVRILHGMEMLDRFFDTPMQFPADEREARVDAILFKAVEASTNGSFRPGNPIPFSREEAQFLIGLNFRLSLHDTIWASQLRRDLGIVQTPLLRMRRREASREIMRISYMEYFDRFVLPYYRDVVGEVGSREEMVQRSDLREVSSLLRTAEGLRVFTNENDFLLSNDDVRWLVSTLGVERVRLYRRGGHLGNLYNPEIQSEIVRSISDLLPGGGAASAGEGDGADSVPAEPAAPTNERMGLGVP